jgi:hypothetical protein
MQCDDFETRLFELLDARQDPCRDTAVLKHASQCAECERSLAGWCAVAREIDSRPLVYQSLPASSSRPVNSTEVITHAPVAVRNGWLGHWNGPLAGVAMAAVWLLAAFWQQPPHEIAPVQISSVAEVAPSAIDLTEIQQRVQQPQWWGSVVVAAWQPVDPLAKGFRPLADSLHTALQLFAPRNMERRENLPTPPSDDASAGSFDFYFCLA